MRAEQIHELLVNPKSLRYEKHLPLLRDALKNYPFFTPSYVLIAKLLYEEKSIYFEKYLKLASLYIGDREVLYNYIHELAPTLSHSLKKFPLKEEVVSPKVELQKTETLEKTEVIESVFENKEIFKEEVSQDKIELYSSQESNKPIIQESSEKVVEDIPLIEIEANEEIIEPKIQESAEIEVTVAKEVEIEDSSKKDLEIESKVDKLELKEDISIEKVEDLETSSAIDDDAEPELIQLVEKEEEEIIINTLENEDSTEIVEIANPEQIDLIETQEPKVQTFLEWLASQKNNEVEVIQSNYNQIKRKETNKIIENFIANEPKISRQTNAKMYNPIIKSVESNQEDPEIVSETLASIFAKQDLFDQAIQQYQKLSILYPQKSSYFANLIEILEDKKAQKQ